MKTKRKRKKRKEVLQEKRETLLSLAKRTDNPSLVKMKAVSNDIMKRCALPLEPFFGEGDARVKYNPAVHPFLVLALMSQGLSQQEVAPMLGVHARSVRRWREEHEEFAEALNEGESLSQAWWLRMGRLNLMNDKFNNTLFIANMCNRFGWTRKLEGNVNVRSENVQTQRLEVSVELEKSATAGRAEQIIEILRQSNALQIGESGTQDIIDAEID